MTEQETAAGTAMANDLAHKINNPLQSLTNLLYLAAEGTKVEDVKAAVQHASGDLEKLSELVKKLLALPYCTRNSNYYRQATFSSNVWQPDVSTNLQQFAEDFNKNQA